MIELVSGAIGSGKSVLLNKRAVEKAMKGRRIVTNFSIDKEALYYCLRRRKMSSSAADDVIKTHEVLRTYEQLRNLQDVWVGMDEAHFWFFSRMWQRIDISDVQFWSQSRKRKVDVTLVTQRPKAIDATVVDLAQIHWEAQALISKEASVFPFQIVKLIHDMNMSSHEAKFLAMFRYIRLNDIMGSTAKSRKGFMGAVNNVSVMGLRRDEARIYATGEFFTSPLIEEDAREQRAIFLRKVLTGELLPLMLCRQCSGEGTAFQSIEIANDVLQKVMLKPTEITSRDFLTRCPCPVCNGKGYYTDPDPDDKKEAERWAAAGMLGPEYLPDAAPAPKSRGGWASRGGRSN